jgi:hypothetical protein
MKLKVTTRNVYGHDRVYPRCPATQVWVDRAGRETMTYDEFNELLAFLAMFGIKPEVEIQPWPSKNPIRAP